MPAKRLKTRPTQSRENCNVEPANTWAGMSRLGWRGSLYDWADAPSVPVDSVHSFVADGVTRRMPGANQELSLFELSAQVPEGFLYRPSFISDVEERYLIETIQTLQLTPFLFHQFIGKRRTKSFGWDYEFGAGKITEAAGLPEFLLPLRKRAGSLFKIPPDDLVQATIIEYSPGAPIGWHRDIPQFGAVIGISLGAPCRLKFRQHRHPRSRQRARDAVVSKDLQPRSIYLLSGPARESWQHSIPAVKELRYSIVMRTLRAKRT